MSQAVHRLQLKRHEDRRLRAGHLWVFSNEVEIERTPLTAVAPGEWVELTSSNGQALGRGYANPRSLICARLMARVGDRRAPEDLIRDRLVSALQWRESLYPAHCYRWVYGESDGLPGLVVDRYADVLVVQITTAGMEAQLDSIISMLAELAQPSAILLRNDVPVRELEGLPLYTRVALGSEPEALRCDENQAQFLAPASGGQKTGWFYDQRSNRARLGAYVAGKRVLDLYSYMGGWAVQAALAGASEVVAVDSSADALSWAERNAGLNQVGDRIEWRKDDVVEALRNLRGRDAGFDVVVLDPPAFIKRKRDQQAGIKAYHQVNRLAMQVLRPGGVLVSCSCSQHLSRQALLQLVGGAARKPEWRLQIVEQGSQAPDHPVLSAMPETEYLKVVFTRLLVD